MEFTQLLPTMSLARAESLSKRSGEVRKRGSSGRNPPVIECVKLAGFVEVRGDTVQLRTGGKSILLTGRTDRARAYEGLEIVVTGQFAGPDVFRADGIARLPAV
jgi:hypothetical protein